MDGYPIASAGITERYPVVPLVVVGEETGIAVVIALHDVAGHVRQIGSWLARHSDFPSPGCPSLTEFLLHLTLRTPRPSQKAS